MFRLHSDISFRFRSQPALPFGRQIGRFIMVRSEFKQPVIGQMLVPRCQTTKTERRYHPAIAQLAIPYRAWQRPRVDYLRSKTPPKEITGMMKSDPFESRRRVVSRKMSGKLKIARNFCSFHEGKLNKDRWAPH